MKIKITETIQTSTASTVTGWVPNRDPQWGAK